MNRCERPYRNYPDTTLNFSCYELDDFISKVKNSNVSSYLWSHEDVKTNELFHLSQFTYYMWV